MVSVQDEELFSSASWYPNCTFSAYLEEFGQIWRADLSKHVAFGESLHSVNLHLRCILHMTRAQLMRTISAKSANRTQNFSSCTCRYATGTPSLSTPNTFEALLLLPSNRTSLPICMFCNCESVPFLQTDTSGCQAWDVSALRTADAGAVKVLRIVIVQPIEVSKVERIEGKRVRGM